MEREYNPVKEVLRTGNNKAIRDVIESPSGIKLAHIPNIPFRDVPFSIPHAGKALDVFPKARKATYEIKTRLSEGEVAELPNVYHRPQATTLIVESANIPVYQEHERDKQPTTYENPNRNQEKDFYSKPLENLLFECQQLVKAANVKKPYKKELIKLSDNYEMALRAINLCECCLLPLHTKQARLIDVTGEITDLPKWRNVHTAKRDKLGKRLKMTLNNRYARKTEISHNETCVNYGEHDTTKIIDCDCTFIPLQYFEVITHTKICVNYKQDDKKIVPCDCRRRGQFELRFRGNHYKERVTQVSDYYADIPCHFEVSIVGGKLTYKFIGITRDGEMLDNIRLERIPREVWIKNKGGQACKKIYSKLILVECLPNGEKIPVVSIPKTYRIVGAKCQC